MSGVEHVNLLYSEMPHYQWSAYSQPPIHTNDVSDRGYDMSHS